MKYVNAINRITAIDKGISRIINRNDERCDEIWDKLEDKRDVLVKSIKDYLRCPDRTDKELRRRSFVRRKQVKVACRLLNVDYYKIIR